MDVVVELHNGYRHSDSQRWYLTDDENSDNDHQHDCDVLLVLHSSAQHVPPSLPYLK